LGLLNRLMSQLQIFFIAMPGQILLGLIFLALCLSGIILNVEGRIIQLYEAFG
jgi:flagellar biosynthesis protein FliR